MNKLSRPVLYAIVLGVAAYAVVLYTEPEPVTPSSTVRTTAARKADGAPPEIDLKANFPRYASKSKDAFKPLVASTRGGKLAPAAPNVILAETGAWGLTGITVVDGVRSAVMENQTTHDVVFLREGDRWNGLKVSRIGADAIVLMNALDKPVRLTFAEPPTVSPPRLSVVPTPSAATGQPAGVGQPPGTLPVQPGQPGFQPGQPGVQPAQPGQPGQPGGQPGFQPGQPVFQPAQPGFQPGFQPGQPAFQPGRGFPAGEGRPRGRRSRG